MPVREPGWLIWMVGYWRRAKLLSCVPNSFRWVALCLSCSQRWVTLCQKRFLWLGLLPGLGHLLLCKSLSGRWLRAISTAGLPINSVLLCV